MKKRVRKIGVGFITGRKSFRDVLTTYIKSWGDRVLSTSETVELSLFVAYDLEYKNTSRSDYTNINIELRDMMKDIHFLSQASIKAEAHSLCSKGVVTAKEAGLLFEKGYAGKRNAILYSAIKNKMDAVLFLDDDEYPLAVQKHDNIESWTGQQILSTHLSSIDDAYITNGHHCGYVSPIPTLRFNSDMTEPDFMTFIQAISNDIISCDSIHNIMQNGGVSYASSQIMAGAAEYVRESNGTKFISGSNLCINLSNTAEVTPFYNPPGARGEDTFLSTMLSDKKVLRVPCYTFHDGFMIYPTLLNGVLPKKLRSISGSTKKVANRFYSACIGWIRYKPLLLYITRRNEYDKLIAQMRKDLQHSLPRLCAYFDDPRFMKISDELDRYDDRVINHYDAFMRQQHSWINLTASLND